MSERQIEMLWTCTSCGNKNLGRYDTCQACKNPKDGSEEWEMPSDTAAAPTVTDPKLLAMATAGANWRCGYCGSDQRNTDGTCKSCGGKKAEGRSLDEVQAPAPVPRQPRASRGPVVAAVLGGLVLSMGTCVGCVVWLGSPEEVEAKVGSVSWKHRVKVERWQVVDHEGFAEARPANANAIKSLGQREHHREQVLDHYETEHYTVKEQDGYRTESYTERVKCGETCTGRPKSCKETCKPNKNGFATCKTTCTGGGERCTTKYCSERRTKQVPRYKDVRKTRQVPRYRSEPRFAEFFAWKSWEWKPNRVVEAEGSTSEVRWPSEEEIDAGVRLEEGEAERSVREGTWEVTFVAAGEKGERRFPHPCKSLEEFQLYPLDSPHRLRLKASDQTVLAIDPGRDY